MERTKTVKYVVVKVVVNHDVKTDPELVCYQADLTADANGGYVEKAEVVDVLGEEDIVS